MTVHIPSDSALSGFVVDVNSACLKRYCDMCGFVNGSPDCGRCFRGVNDRAAGDNARPMITQDKQQGI